MLQVFYLDVVYVLQWVSSVFQVFFASVSDACFKCFICLFLYVASVASECFRSRLGVAHGMYVEARGCASAPCTGDIRVARVSVFWTTDK